MLRKAGIIDRVRLVEADLEQRLPEGDFDEDVETYHFCQPTELPSDKDEMKRALASVLHTPDEMGALIVEECAGNEIMDRAFTMLFARSPG